MTLKKLRKTETKTRGEVSSSSIVKNDDVILNGILCLFVCVSYKVKKTCLWMTFVMHSFVVDIIKINKDGPP